MKKAQRPIAFLVFGIYLVALVYLLFFSDAYGRTEAYATYHYSLIPFREIRRYLFSSMDIRLKLINIGGNILAFVPYGFLVPALFPKLRKWWIVMLLTALFSVCVEGIQLIFRIGACDVDDVILNTAGGLLGFLLLVLTDNIVKKNAEKKKV